MLALLCGAENGRDMERATVATNEPAALTNNTLYRSDVMAVEACIPTQSESSIQFSLRAHGASFDVLPRNEKRGAEAPLNVGVLDDTSTSNPIRLEVNRFHIGFQGLPKNRLTVSQRSRFKRAQGGVVRPNGNIGQRTKIAGSDAPCQLAALETGNHPKGQ